MPTAAKRLPATNAAGQAGSGTSGTKPRRPISGPPGARHEYEGVQCVIERLSPEAQVLIHRSLDQRQSPDNVRRAVFRLTGERVSTWAITEYASRYTARCSEFSQAQAGTNCFVQLAGKRGVTISELLRAGVIEALVKAQRSGRLEQTDLFKLAEAERKQRELDLKQLKAAQEHRRKEFSSRLLERKVELVEKRLRLDREKAQKAAATLERKAASGRSLAPADLRRIRDIYGLNDQQAESPAGESMEPPEIDQQE